MNARLELEINIYNRLLQCNRTDAIGAILKERIEKEIKLLKDKRKRDEQAKRLPDSKRRYPGGFIQHVLETLRGIWRQQGASYTGLFFMGQSATLSQAEVAK